MECPRVCVIDRSPVIRSTVAVVLGDGYHVLALSPDEYRSAPAVLDSADVVIIGTDALPPHACQSLPTTAALIWVQESSDVAPPSDRGTRLPRPFTAEGLRAHLRTVLAAPPQAAAPPSAALLPIHPVFPHEVVAVARRAAETALPVLIRGESGTGKVRLARGIHVMRGIGQIIALPARQMSRQALLDAAAPLSGPLTLLVNDIADLSLEGVQFVREVLDAGGLRSAAGWHNVRLVSATILPLDTLAQQIDRETFYRLAVFPLSLPPLRDRVEDIPALARHVAATLAASLGRAPVDFTDRALERLAQYFWFGNVAELENVLTRSIVLADSRTIDANDLWFNLGPRTRPGTSAQPAAGAAAPAPPKGVDLIINELAHEFKNPMVTIKTVAQHLERLLEDTDGREQISRLTGEAVDRMDRALENLLQFTRFGVPAPATVGVGALLAACLNDLNAIITERKLSVHVEGADGVLVRVDAAQTQYALENLLRVILRDLRDGDPLTIRVGDAPAAVAFEFRSRQRSTARKLAEMLDQADNEDDTAAPIGLVFAETMVARNGGRVQIARDEDQTTITVFLPQEDCQTSAHGTSTRSHS